MVQCTYETHFDFIRCSESVKEIENTKLERARLELETEKEKTRRQELEVRQRELALQQAEMLEKEKTKQHELDEKKAHWEQMSVDLQFKKNAEQQKAKSALAEAQKKQAESAQQAIQEFRKLKEDGVGVTNRDLTTLLHSIPQPVVNGQELIPRPRHRLRTWAAPIKTLHEQDESV